MPHNCLIIGNNNMHNRRGDQIQKYRKSLYNIIMCVILYID